MPNSPTRPLPPIDRAKLKQAADRLAALLNDFRTGGLQLAAGDHDGWLVQPEGEWHRSVYARVSDLHGYWDTNEVNGPAPEPKQSLADRLRSLAAEVEALAASCPVGQCASRYQPGLAAWTVRCGREAGHDGAHLSQAELGWPLGPSEQFMWRTADEVAR